MSARVRSLRVRGRSGILDTVSMIITRQSASIINSKKEQMLKNMRTAREKWRKHVRKLLSVPAEKQGAGYKRNLSLWPKLRKGNLRDAILEPEILVERRTAQSGIRKNQIVFTFKDFYGVTAIDRSRKFLDMKDSSGNPPPFADWMNRANALWYDYMISHGKMAKSKKYASRRKKG